MTWIKNLREKCLKVKLKTSVGEFGGGKSTKAL